MWSKIQEYAKFVAALLGVVASAFNAYIPSNYQGLIAAVIAALTAIAVLVVPNAVTPKQVAAITTATAPTP